jgi:penicillin-binding protein 2
MRLVQEGMRAAVTIEGGTALPAQDDYLPYVPIAGKTGTAEFCDNIAAALDQCVPGNWPAHAWFLSYAPYGNPEIAVLAFIYNGGEGSSIALPVASQVMDAYFQLKAQRAVEAQATPTGTAEP